jgi:glycosyltransferase involved in cell wall biosynthesis
MAAPLHGRIALVHDFLLDRRGAERVFAEVCAMFPGADVFTAVYDPRGTEGAFSHHPVHTTGLQRVRPTARTFRALFPFYPAAMERLDLTGYDIVLSSSSAWAHGVLPDEHAVHVCYCHNPFRYAWNARAETLAACPLPLRPVLATLLARWRAWDTLAARRVDRYVANSEVTRRRVHRYLGRESTVVHPPVETSRFAPGPVGEHYVVLSELMRHKRIDVAVEAFTRLGLPLVVIGKGPDTARLKGLAGPSVSFVGHVPDAEVAKLLSSARALVVTATEEFGIAAVEAQAAGRPVVALGAGGVLESVKDGITGCFYDAPDPDALIAAVRGFDPLGVDPAACVASAHRFDAGHFRAALRAQLDGAILDAAGGAGAPIAQARRRRARHLAA